MNAANGHPDRGATSSIDFSADDGFAASDTGARPRRVSTSTLVAMGVFMASALGLWSMRTLSSSVASVPETGETVENVREWVWSRSDGGIASSLDALGVIARLDRERLAALQVPVESLRRAHPFSQLDATPHAGEGGFNADLEKSRATQAWERSVRAVVSSIKITATLAPDTPRAQAVLDGTRVMVGDVFEVHANGKMYEFLVARIGPRGVEFEAMHSNGVDRTRARRDVDRRW